MQVGGETATPTLLSQVGEEGWAGSPARCLEVASQGGVTFCRIISNLLDGLLSILNPGDILLAWEMHLELHNIGESTVHEKVEEAPDALTG
jgi:hypothetical protein